MSPQPLSSLPDEPQLWIGAPFIANIGNTIKVLVMRHFAVWSYIDGASRSCLRQPSDRQSALVPHVLEKGR